MSHYVWTIIKQSVMNEHFRITYQYQTQQNLLTDDTFEIRCTANNVESWIRRKIFIISLQGIILYLFCSTNELILFYFIFVIYFFFVPQIWCF